MYIFGGEAKYSPIRRKRELFNDVYEFVANFNSSLKKLSTSGDIPNGRKHHAGCMISSCCLFHGGIDQSGEITNDLILFDTYECKFTDLK